MARLKLVLAMMMHETNTFSPLPTPIESFARAGSLSGPAAIKESEGTNTSLGGFIEVARKAGVEFTVPMAASAHPSGLVTKAAYSQMTTAIVDERWHPIADEQLERMGAGSPLTHRLVKLPGVSHRRARLWGSLQGRVFDF